MSIIERIQKRPAMYIGCLTTRGLKTLIGILFEEILEYNSTTTTVTINYKTNNTLLIKTTITDSSFFEDTLNNLTTQDITADFGITAIIALSERAELNLRNNNSLTTIISRKGNYKISKKNITSNEKSFKVNFKFDEAFFKDIVFNYEILNLLLRKYAITNNKFKFISIDKTSTPNQTNLFHYQDGMSHLLDCNISKQLSGATLFRLDLSTQIKEFEYKISFAYHDNWLEQSNVEMYAYYDELILNDSFRKGIIEGVFSALKQLAELNNTKINKKNLKKKLLITASVKGGEFCFSGSTKNGLYMPNLRKDVKKFVAEQTFLKLKNDTIATQKILNQLISI